MPIIESTMTGDQICIHKDFIVVFNVLKRLKEIIKKELNADYSNNVLSNWKYW